MDGQRKSKKIMNFKNFSNTIQYFLLVVSRPLRRVFKTFSWKSSKKNKISMIFFKFRTIFFSNFFNFSHPFFVSQRFFFTPIFCHQFFKVGKVENYPMYRTFFTFCKCSNSSDFIGKISTFSIHSENWHTYRPGIKFRNC